MPLTYRLQPANPWPTLGVAAAIMAVILIVPLIAWIAIPERPASENAEPVVLGSYDSAVEIPLEYNGQPVSCAPDSESVFLKGYDCGDVWIDSIIHRSADVKDPEQTLRRMITAGSGGLVTGTTPIEREGDVLYAYDDRYLGILAPLDDGDMIYVELGVWDYGDETAGYGQAVWESLFDEPLPDALARDLGADGALPPALPGSQPEVVGL